MISEKQKLELKEKYNPEGSNRRLAQIRMVEMLEQFDDFCTKHQISYWLDCGTLLGAIRHGGFIPWDDDVDVCMTRADFKRFTKLFKNGMYPNLVLQTPKTDSGFYRFWNVLRDLKTEYIKGGDNPCEQMLRYRGLQIDIFPVISRYSNFSMWLSKKVDWRIRHYSSIEASRQFRWRTALLFNLANNIIYPLMRFFFWQKQKYVVMDYGIGFYHEKRREQDIFPLSKVEFEGIVLSAPKNPIAYCELLYGKDCLDMPKESQIYNHNTTVLFK